MVFLYQRKGVPEEFKTPKLYEILDKIADDPDVVEPPVKRFDYYYANEMSNTIEPSHAEYVFVPSKVLEYLNDEYTREYIGDENYDFIYKFMKFIIDDYGDAEFIIQVGF